MFVLKGNFNLIHIFVRIKIYAYSKMVSVTQRKRDENISNETRQHRNQTTLHIL